MSLTQSHRNVSVAVFLIFLALAFVQGMNAVRGLNWGYDYDPYRDMAFAQTILDGRFGEDPSYSNEYLWYNPLIPMIESAIVKLTGIPINKVVTSAGAYLNLLAPVTFFLMMCVLFDVSIALAALAGFIFFNMNDMPVWTVASYSPWLYPVTFTQCFFYTGIILIYKAFSTWKIKWFVFFGIVAGICFTGHSAPALLLVAIAAVIGIASITESEKHLRNKAVRKVFQAGILCFLVFALFSLPLTWFVVGKYKLHMVNTYTYEYTDTLFQLKNVLLLLKNNLSVAVVLSVYGCIYFFTSNINKTIRLIMFCWLTLCIFFYFYTSGIVVLRYHFNIQLPGIVPSFHFFFYLKAAEALFFGIGLYQLLYLVYKFIVLFIGNKWFLSLDFRKHVFPAVLIIIVLINYPFYAESIQFIENRQMGLDENKAHFDNEAYQWILQHTSNDDVFLCDVDLANYPVLASARKMVAVSPSMSNPYVSYIQRNNDRNRMLAYLMGRGNANDKSLFTLYMVKYLLVHEKEKQVMPLIENMFPMQVYANAKYIIYKIR